MVNSGQSLSEGNKKSLFCRKQKKRGKEDMCNHMIYYMCNNLQKVQAEKYFLNFGNTVI